MKKKLWRQGDLLIQETTEIPEFVQKMKRLVLASGEASGHSHRIAEEGVARLYRSKSRSEIILGTIYLDVYGERATLVHNEHGPITLIRGRYKVWKQREALGMGFGPVFD